MPQIIPYLNFDGNCAEAMRFYERTLGGKLELMTFRSTPMADDTPAEYRDKIMHACLSADGQSLMASDAGPWAPFEGSKGFSVALIYSTAVEGQRIFDALAEGGNVTMPMQKTFSVEAFGMVTDRFGTPWLFNAGKSSQ